MLSYHSPITLILFFFPSKFMDAWHFFFLFLCSVSRSASVWFSGLFCYNFEGTLSVAIRMQQANVYGRSVLLSVNRQRRYCIWYIQCYSDKKDCHEPLHMQQSQKHLTHTVLLVTGHLDVAASCCPTNRFFLTFSIPFGVHFNALNFKPNWLALS